MSEPLADALEESFRRILAEERAKSNCDAIRTYAGYYDHESVTIAAMLRVATSSSEAAPIALGNR